ncbi:hypothetical protein CCZ01_00090 [Helicobacter monodelphidis]|uniref:mechanosensitive ion channel family protein n=1 Tax=Helicobacter sp. 15-1451 TaxID=2004995 RepID=UPI000DCE9557|nr:mechanosensitive ion channel family protein [Helicobacter sp. 15-1451]RAX59183.1 hypothetical protein CCZ01_00090 [Helicobacter sp. 15-1451]
MKTILIFLCFFCLQLKATNSEYDFVDLFLIATQIQEVNQQINIFQEKSDKNKLLSAEESKKKLLEKIPQVLEISSEKLQILEIAINKGIADNKQKQAEYEQSNKLALLVQTKIEFLELQTDKIIYEWVKKFQEIRQNHYNADEKLQLAIQETLRSLQSLDVADIIFGLEQLNEPARLKQLFEESQIKIKTYEDILKYTQEHTSIILDNYLTEVFQIQNLIQWLNQYYSFSFWRLDFGKAILCVFTLILFWSFRHLLAFGTFKIISLIFGYQESKQIVVSAIIRPITWFLFFNGFDLSLDIIYFPSSPPDFFGKSFDVIYIVNAAWFCITLLECYGTLLLSNINKRKSDLFRKEVVNLILKFLDFTVITIALLIILARLGFNISALIASLGIGGLAVALAAKDILANFFASVMLLFDNAFSQGDWIVCGNVEGTVVEIGLRRTTVRTTDNALLFVPNSKLANESIRNWNRREMGRRIRMIIGLTYDSPKHKIQECVQDIRTMLLNHPQIAKAKDIPQEDISYLKQDIVSMHDLKGYKANLVVCVDELADSSINILVHCFSISISWSEWLSTKESVILGIMDIVEKHGLSFAFPSQSVYIESTPKA